ncbi:hypothetical protein V6U77_14270 [Micromonospora sp. CPCC 205546]|uniref:hypothetical protein n=1 Tax=Micromonospora sp. CPCC 205546 TaxID=3122397 RepID=UPI002FF033B7
MTATLNDQNGRRKRPEPSAEAKAAAELVRGAKEQGLSLKGILGLWAGTGGEGAKFWMA